MADVMQLHILLFIHNHFLLESEHGTNRMKVSLSQECNNLFLIFDSCSFAIWIYFFDITTCITIFNREDTSIWSFWYVSKDMEPNCLVWWRICNLFFRYCYISEITTTTQNKIPIWKTVRVWSNIPTFDRLFCTTWSFISVINIWVYFINLFIFTPILTGYS